MKVLKVMPEELDLLKGRATLRSTFHILDVTFSVHTDEHEIVDLFEQIYRRFKAASHAADHHFYVIARGGFDGTPCVIMDEGIYPVYGSELFYSHAYMVIFNELRNLFRDFFLIHAGVVSRRKEAIIIAGPSSFGKTTLTLELVKRGFKFLSDEFCAVDRNDGLIYSFPRSLSVRADSLCMVKGMGGEKMAGTGIHGKEPKKWMDIEDWQGEVVEAAAAGKFLFFLRGNRSSSARGDERIIDLVLIGEDPELIDELCGVHPGTRFVLSHEGKDCRTYRFVYKQAGGVSRRFEEVCERHPKNLLYYELVSTEAPEFDREPLMEEIPKSLAAFELMRNLVNRSPRGRAVSDFRTSSALLMRLGKVVKEMSCYNLFVGRLGRMADLIMDAVGV